MDVTRAELRGWSLVGRCAAVGAVAGGVIGALAGLILGLDANPATAWFAIFELGIPAFIAGGLVGCIGALIVTAARWITRSTLSSV